MSDVVYFTPRRAVNLFFIFFYKSWRSRCCHETTKKKNRQCQLTLECFLLSLLLLGLDGVKDGGADEQVGERADDEAEGADVLLLHAPTLRVAED